jgi:mannose-1-phosphate guanylyltransferase/phosphomannomutase
MKAMVLCAGFGTRLGDLTRESPKPMLPLGDLPLLAYILGHLKTHGFTDIVINLHFRPEAIQAHFGDGSSAGLKLNYILEPNLLGTAGAVRNAAEFFRRERDFLVHYGDILTDQDFSAMLRFHREKDAVATLLLHQRAKSNSIVDLDPSGRITGFLERPSDEARLGQTSRWVNSGVCICRPEAIDFIPNNMPADFPRDVFPKLIGTGRVYGFALSGYRCAIDSVERLAEARAALATGRCRIHALSTKT